MPILDGSVFLDLRSARVCDAQSHAESVGGAQVKSDEQIPRTPHRRSEIHIEPADAVLEGQGVLRRLSRSVSHATETRARRMAAEFGVVPTPQQGWSLLASGIAALAVCLTIAAPYASNEILLRSAVVRGLIVGVLASGFVVPTFSIVTPILTKGTSDRRFLLSSVFTIAPAVAAAAVPLSSGQSLGAVSIYLIAVASGFGCSLLALNLPLTINAQHRQLDQNFGAPLLMAMPLHFCHFLVSRVAGSTP